MCGILAWVGDAPPEARLAEALTLLSHRGPDGRGSWAQPPVWLGHTRLSVIDLSERAAQPMSNEDGQVQLTFNGEIYNFRELRRELESKGHRFRSDSDTEVVVHAYEEYGTECVERLWGMFAFAIWDARLRRLFAARDRFGKKPLSYVHRVGQLVLASEIPALLGLGISERRADMSALACFWNLGYVPAPLSAFEDIAKLPAGHTLTWQNGKLQIKRYYPPRSVEPFRGTYEDAQEEFRTLLRDAVRRRLVSDVPLGIALSGGLDSGAVAAFAAEEANGRLLTFTVRTPGIGDDYDEGPWARATAERLGTEHREVEPDLDLSRCFETVVSHAGEPFALGSAASCYFLFQAIRPHATVVLSGDGGDELFCGYPVYRHFRTISGLRRLLWRPVGRALYRGFDLVYGASAPCRPGLQPTLAALQVLLDRPPTDPPWEQRRILQPETYRSWVAPGGLTARRAALASLFAEREPLRREMAVDQFDGMADHILSKVDLTSMTHSVEVRSPLLDHRIAEFARSLPTPYLLWEGKGKRLIRDGMSDRLPASVLHKRKTGFGLPFTEWLSGAGRRYALDLLMSPSQGFQALVRRERLAEVFERHGAGRPPLTTLLLRLIALRLWLGQSGAVVA